MPSPHVDDKKGKKAMVYKGRKDRRKGEAEQEEKGKNRSLGHVRRDLLLHSMLVSLIFLQKNNDYNSINKSFKTLKGSFIIVRT